MNMWVQHEKNHYRTIMESLKKRVRLICMPVPAEELCRPSKTVEVSPMSMKIEPSSLHAIESIDNQCQPHLDAKLDPEVNS